MRLVVRWGENEGSMAFPEGTLLDVRRHPVAPPLADVTAAVAAALEQPLGFPPLRRALTPDDHVAIVVDESLDALPRLLSPILQHLQQAQVSMAAVTLICPQPSTGQPWLDSLPDEFQDVQVEVHQPGDRKKLAYLATMRQGRRLYLNRTLVDADQSVVLTRRGYDGVLGYSGGAGAVFPALSDEATERDLRGTLNLAAPGGEPWKMQREAAEAVWLLGVPFFVQIIDNAAGEILHVIGGPLESGADGERLLNERWRIEIDEPADLVIGTLGGDATRHTFADLARAWNAAARIVRPGGSIVLLTDAAPDLGPSAAFLRCSEDPDRALKLLSKEPPEDFEAGFQWANAAAQAKLYLLSRLPMEVAEELFTTPLENIAQAQRLVRGQCAVLPDAHRTLAVVRES